MNKFIVTLGGGLLQRQETVIADKFVRDSIFRIITFVDKEGKAVAMFKLDDIKSINIKLD